MDPTRRHLVLSLALVPALTAARPHSAAASTLLVPKPPLTLVAVEGRTLPRPPLGYGDGSPGPVLRMTRGIAERIVVQNAMTGPTSLDLHGLRLSPPLDRAGPLGGIVPPGESADITVVPDDAGTFWYHPWALDPRIDQTAQGLSGVLIVDEPVPPEVDADLVAVLTDRWPLVAPSEGREAESLRIDGQPWPRTETLRPGARVRLRVLNASTRRAVAVTSTGTTPWVVAIDGQPSELFKPLADSVPVGPGARFDLMFDMPAAGGEVRLLIGAGGGPALSIKAAGELVPAREPIRPLPPNPLLPAEIHLERATRATLVAARQGEAKPGGTEVWTLSGVSGRDLPKVPLFRTKRGAPVVLALRNSSSDLVSFRVHGVAMRLLHDLDDGWEPYWRDSILVPPGTTHHAAFLAELPGRWLIESPFFAQTAGGFRTWFEIT